MEMREVETLEEDCHCYFCVCFLLEKMYMLSSGGEFIRDMEMCLGDTFDLVNGNVNLLARRAVTFLHSSAETSQTTCYSGSMHSLHEQK